MYRWPKDTPQFNQTFYQTRYRQGLTTARPDALELARLKASLFRGTEKDLAEKIALLRVLMPQGKVLDFGCSWGYGTFQLREAGYEVVGFEISKPRAEFGRCRLGVSIVSSESCLEALTGSFDCVFASHVLEHLPAPAAVFDRLSSLLKPNGLLLGFVPNCGGAEARRLGVRWGPMCCAEHPLALNAEFLARALPRHGFQCSFFSSPYQPELIADAFNGPDDTRDLRGDELMICARKIMAMGDGR
jgi:2-polyprenyl-3-methyl-5-hydroxy-6-metoxy-1,4-benzoquinol methylase